MISEIKNRLNKLELQYKDDPLIVLAQLKTGETVKITMRELLNTPGAQFIRVISGSSIKDLEMYLEAVRQEAFNERKV